MRVAWLADAYDPPGGAELTQAEFRAAAPAGVEVVDCPPGALERLAGCDVACLHNSVTYPAETVDALAGKPALRYWHDLARGGGPGDPALVRWALDHATSVFTSPLHRDRFPHALARREPRSSRRRSTSRASARTAASARAAPAGSAPACTSARGCCRRSSGPRRTSPSTSGGRSPPTSPTRRTSG